MAEADVRFRFTVLGRYRTRLGRQPNLTITMAAGPGDHLVFCGTFTIGESEWAALREVLVRGLGDRVEVEGPAPG